jgi:hypothetical protein
MVIAVILLVVETAIDAMFQAVKELVPMLIQIVQATAIIVTMGTVLLTTHYALEIVIIVLDMALILIALPMKLIAKKISSVLIVPEVEILSAVLML